MFSDLLENCLIILEVFVALLFLSSLAVARCLLGRARVNRVELERERVREDVEKLMTKDTSTMTHSQS